MKTILVVSRLFTLHSVGSQYFSIVLQSKTSLLLYIYIFCSSDCFLNLYSILGLEKEERKERRKRKIRNDLKLWIDEQYECEN